MSNNQRTVIPIEKRDYENFTKPAELQKATNVLKGLLKGIAADSVISDAETKELLNWCLSHDHLRNRFPFDELIPLIRDACADNIITADERNDIIWLCDHFLEKSDYYDIITSSLQFLSGLVHGILADNIITDEEIESLNAWIQENSYLTGNYPFDEIESLLLSILQDKKVTDEERDILKAFLGSFIDTSLSYNINKSDIDKLREKYSVQGICSACQEIIFEDSTFCFTGQSTQGTREEIKETITSLGGIFRSNVSAKTDYLIVGNYGNPCWAYSCYGRKIEDAVRLRKKGSNLLIVNEIDFWDIIEDF